MIEHSANPEDSWRNHLADYLQAVALANVAFVLMITVFATFGFLVGLRLSTALLPLAAVATFATIRVFTPSWRVASAATAVAAIAHIVAYFLAAFFFDRSWDGLAYHEEAVLQLASGWNPLFHDTHQIWIDHYPKGSWIAGAAIFLNGGQLEAGKLFNFTLMLAAGAQLAAALLRLTTLRPVTVILIVILGVLNPVAICQTTSFCVDGATASLFTVTAAGLIIYVASPRWSNLALPLFAACLLINLKFTGLIYAVILLLSAVLVVWLHHGFRTAAKLACAAAIVGAIGVLALGYSPYVRNLREKGHPFYPLMGQGKVDILTAIRPINIAGKDRFTRFAIANFSRSESVRPPRATTLKFPLRLEPIESSAWGSGNTEAGGFGPFFGALLLMAGVGLCLLLGNRTTRGRVLPMCLIVGSLLLTIFVHADGWWARYAPQAWLIPLLVIIYLLMAPQPGYVWFGWAMLSLTIANVLIVGLYFSRNEWGYSREVRNSLHEISSAPQPVTVYLGRFQSLRERLREGHVDFKLIETRPDTTATTGWRQLPSPDGDALWGGVTPPALTSSELSPD
jgi:hypothetical protein